MELTAIEKLREASRTVEEKQQEVIKEILDYFQKRLDRPEFEEYIVKSSSKGDAARDRKNSWTTEFWGYHDGCSSTCFRTAGQVWENPQSPHGYKSYYYKEVNLQDISNRVGPQILKMTVDKFKSMGFNVEVKDREGWLKYYHKLVIITW